MCCVIRTGGDGNRSVHSSHPSDRKTWRKQTSIVSNHQVFTVISLSPSHCIICILNMIAELTTKSVSNKSTRASSICHLITRYRVASAGQEQQTTNAWYRASVRSSLLSFHSVHAHWMKTHSSYVTSFPYKPIWIYHSIAQSERINSTFPSTHIARWIPFNLSSIKNKTRTPLGTSLNLKHRFTVLFPSNFTAVWWVLRAESAPEYRPWTSWPRHSSCSRESTR